jgi:hypothetical protein
LQNKRCCELPLRKKSIGGAGDEIVNEPVGWTPRYYLSKKAAVYKNEFLGGVFYCSLASFVRVSLPPPPLSLQKQFYFTEEAMSH